MDDAREDLQRAREAVTAMYSEGDPVGFVRPYREALSEDQAADGDMRRIGLVSALTLIAASAMHELDRAGGRPGAAQEWMQAAALRDFKSPEARALRREHHVSTWGIAAGHSGVR